MTNHSIALLLLAAAVLLSSRAGAARTRLATLTETRGSRPRQVSDKATHLLLTGTAAALSAMLIGVIPAVAVAVAVWWFLRRARRPPKTDPMTLAAAWDLLAACLRAGLPVPTAVTAVAGELPETAATALRSSAELLALGADPATAWAPAIECADTAALARGVRRAALSGTALAELVTDLAATIRAGAADQAEAQAQRAGVLITAPLGLCFLPAFICLGIAPVIAGLAGQITQ
jgi:Flp pilus assembly protein TadB